MTASIRVDLLNGLVCIWLLYTIIISLIIDLRRSIARVSQGGAALKEGVQHCRVVFQKKCFFFLLFIEVIAVQLELAHQRVLIIGVQDLEVAVHRVVVYGLACFFGFSFTFSINKGISNVTVKSIFVRLNTGTRVFSGIPVRLFFSTVYIRKSNLFF